MSQTRRRLELTFTSDWHIGTGAGIPGSVDRQVLRDGDGLPYVPGKTLTGILRDAAEWVADTRDQLEGGDRWQKALISLFGEQPENYYNMNIPAPREAQSAKIGVGSARLGKDVRRCIIGADRAGKDSGLTLSSALVQVHPGVKIDPATGRAKDDHLFSTERARWDCALYADVTILDGKLDKLDPDEEALLDDAIKAVRRIGGKRRRGAGLCRLAWKDKAFVAGPIEHDDNEALFDLKDIRQNDGPVTLDVRLTARQPIIINRKNIGNAIETDTEIPGTALLSYYAQEVLSPLGNNTLRKAIMNGELSAGTFLPEIEGRRALPVPLCLVEEKEERDGIKRIINGLRERTDPGRQTKELRSGYVIPNEKDMTYHAASDQKIIRTHNTIEDDVQRPTENVGGLFTYEAIQTGKTFRGTLKIGDGLWKNIRGRDDILDKLSLDKHTFGRSRKDEYGRALLECQGVVEDRAGDDERLSQAGLIEGRTDKARDKRYLVVYLASDLLLRDEANGYSVKVEDVKKALERALEIKLRDVPAEEWTKIKQKDDKDILISPLGGPRGHSVRTGRRESWQRSWNLPRPSLVYFKAGSVLLFKVMNPDKWDEDKARQLVRKGIGERRAEGYGRLILNPPFLCGEGGKVARPDKQDKSEEGPREDDSITLSEERGFVIALAQDAVKRRFRQLARQEAYNIVREHKNALPNDDIFKEHPGVKWLHHPSSSQFGALREAAATIEPDKDGKNGRAIFLNWVESVKKHTEKEDRWNDKWCNMFASLGNEPHGVWRLRPAFEKLREVAMRQAILNEEALDKMSPGLLGAFLDILCEAFFDETKRKGQDDERVNER